MRHRKPDHSPEDETLFRAIRLMLDAALEAEDEHLTPRDLSELLNRPLSVIQRGLIIMRADGDPAVVG